MNKYERISDAERNRKFPALLDAKGCVTDVYFRLRRVETRTKYSETNFQHHVFPKPIAESHFLFSPQQTRKLQSLAFGTACSASVIAEVQKQKSQHIPSNLTSETNLPLHPKHSQPSPIVPTAHSSTSKPPYRQRSPANPMTSRAPVAGTQSSRGRQLGHHMFAPLARCQLAAEC